MKNLIIRSATHADVPNIQSLFKETIENVNIQDYSDEQVAIWASRGSDSDKWKNRIDQQTFLIAEYDASVVGFASLETNYIDLLYVHKNHQGKGIAYALYKFLEEIWEDSGYKVLETDASKTAVPFFERQGFKVEKANHLVLGSVEITNYAMTKRKRG